MATNLLLLTDSYKLSHHKQYPPATRSVYSYFESRGGQFADVVFFGLQYYLLKYLQGPVVTRDQIEEAACVTRQHLGSDTIFHRAGWDHVLAVHAGRLPVRIRAVPEGTTVPVRNVLMTIENTDPACYWLTNYLETLLVQTWYACTVATQSLEMKKLVLAFLEETGEPALAEYKVHDFGCRGVSSVETAGIGACAHLVSFRGTDTLPGLIVARDYYGCPMAGVSIPAAEHSTITSWGREHEAAAFANMLTQFPEGAVSVVSDSYDIFHACAKLWGTELRQKVLDRNGTLVIRPDSGDPVEVVCKVLTLLGERFGTETNARGYKVLKPHVRVIQGDGIDYDMMQAILRAMKAQGWSADNITFGSGGGLLQKLNRDTLKFAFKCSSVRIGDSDRDVFKDPVTDQGKMSKRGRLKLIRTSAGFTTVVEHEPGDDQLVTVFENGMVKRTWTLDEVRDRAALR